MKIIIDGIDPIEIDTDEITGIRTKTSFSNENITINIFVQGDVSGNVEANGRVEVSGDTYGKIDAMGKVVIHGNKMK